MKLVISLMFALSLPAFAAAPDCVNIRSRSEGWRLPSGKFQPDRCENKTAFCGAIGSRSEGWYVATTIETRRLGFDNCSEDQTRKPACVNIGTRSEGWQAPGGRLLWDQCSEKIVTCGAIGTRSEGWYAVTIDRDSTKLLEYAQCSAE